MDYKYDAFISYRHAEKDTLIASEIQKTLEHFQIPKALRKSSGKERFNRVFRDVEELPLANNLTEELEQALKDSQYLIVICSYSTSESDWVKREIDTFLEFHDYDKQLVLTVLVEGEPGEVIPEVLRHDNITHYLADGTFYCKDELVEPLSADYRQPIKKARKTELPRLAAAMLGCKYDEIIRRRKAYQRKRLLVETAIISAIAVGILVYIGQLYVKQQESLRKAQMSQSIYLASESQRLLENGDRIGAIQLALAAMENSDGSKRPHTDEAEYALTQALGSYFTVGVTTCVPLWRYETESTIKRYRCSYSGEYIAALDSKSAIHIWNTKDHNETIYKESSVSPLDFQFDKDDNLIVCTSSFITVIDVKTQKEKWRFAEGRTDINVDRCFSYYEAKGYIVLNGCKAIYIINAANGQKIQSYEIESRVVDENKGESFIIRDFVFTSDFSKAAIAGKSGDNYVLIVYDVKSDKVYKLAEGEGDFLRVVFDESENVLVLRHLDNGAWLSGVSLTYDAPVLYEKYSASGKKLWSTELSSINQIFDPEIRSSEYILRDGTKKKVAIAVFGNRLVIVDTDSGTTLKTFDLCENIIAATLPAGGRISVVTNNGSLVSIILDENNRKLSSIKLVRDESIKILSFDGKTDDDFRYFVEDSSMKVITEYTTSFSDSDYTGIEGAESTITYEYLENNEDYLLVYHRVATNDNRDDIYLSGVDLKEHKVLWDKKIPVNNYISIQAFSSDNNFLYLLRPLKGTADQDNAKEYNLIKVDVKNGEFKETDSSFKIKGTIDDNICCRGGMIWVRLFNKDGSLTIGSYDLSNDSYKEISVDTAKYGDLNLGAEMTVSSDGKSIILYYSTFEMDAKHFRLVIDSKTGNSQSYGCDDVLQTVLSDDGKYIAERNSKKIKVYSIDGKELYEIDPEQRMARVMEFNNGRLYVLCDTGDLCCFDPNGNKTMDLYLGHGDVNNNSKFEFAQGMLFVITGDNVDIINISSNKHLCSFQGLLCLHNTGKETADLELVVKCIKTRGVPSIGYFKYKTPDLLIKQAKEYLEKNGVKMSEDFKRKYGIE